MNHLGHKKHHQGDVGGEDNGQRGEGEGGVLLRGQDHRHRSRNQTQHLQKKRRKQEEREREEVEKEGRGQGSGASTAEIVQTSRNDRSPGRRSHVLTQRSHDPRAPWQRAGSHQHMRVHLSRWMRTYETIPASTPQPPWQGLMDPRLGGSLGRCCGAESILAASRRQSGLSSIYTRFI